MNIHLGKILTLIINIQYIVYLLCYETQMVVLTRTTQMVQLETLRNN